MTCRIADGDERNFDLKKERFGREIKKPVSALDVLKRVL
jgi:hypothetical protein